MRNYVLVALLSATVTFTANADDLIQFSDGSAAWRNSNGEIWGKTPSPPQPQQNDGGDDQRNDNLTGFGSDGTYFIPGGSGQVLDTRGGRFVPVR